MPSRPTIERAVAAFRSRGGMLRTSEALELGIHSRTLYALRDAGRLMQLGHGIYRLAELPELANPDLSTVAALVPRATICLVSALAFHDITTQIAREVYLALPRGTKTPRVDHPPIRVFRFSGPSLTEGIEQHSLDGVRVRIYSPTKTVADCFKFRNKVGLDVAVEALKLCHDRKDAKLKDFLRDARTCRVEKVMLPYLEMLS